MKRTDLEKWIARHPESIHTDSQALLDQCENVARDYARRDAWHHATEVAEKTLGRFEHGFGYPAGDAFVTREVCHEVARELRHHEPAPEHHEWDKVAAINRSLLNVLDAEARMMFVDWLDDLADQEEHATWTEIVRFTNKRARKIIREEHMTEDCDWDLAHIYPVVAARIVRKLIAEFEAHADMSNANARAGIEIH